MCSSIIVMGDLYIVQKKMQTHSLFQEMRVWIVNQCSAFRRLRKGFHEGQIVTSVREQDISP